MVDAKPSEHCAACFVSAWGEKVERVYLRDVASRRFTAGQLSPYAGLYLSLMGASVRAFFHGMEVV